MDTDDAWPAYLAEAVGAFVLSASEAPGLDPVTAAWLVTVLSAAEPRTAAAIVRILEREGYQLSEDLAAFTKRVGRRPAIPASAIDRKTHASLSDLAYHELGREWMRCRRTTTVV